MRFNSILLCLALGGATPAMAQEAAVGVKAGINSANVKFEGDSANVSFDRRTGFVGGLFVVVPAKGRVALQAEALFSQKGAKINESGATGKVELDYLDIPLLLRVSSPAAPVSFHVFAGPSFGVRLRAHSTGTFEGQTSDEDISDQVKRGDVGLVAGAGLDFGRLTIDGRETWGMSDINKENDPELKIKNRVFSVMVGVRF